MTVVVIYELSSVIFEAQSTSILQEANQCFKRGANNTLSSFTFNKKWKVGKMAFLSVF